MFVKYPEIQYVGTQFMRPSFTPRLINDCFSDPGLFIPFLFEKRALMFDLGDLCALSSRDLLKVSHVFVTHTHMDHFIGFDTLLRVCLNRDKALHVFGPPGFFGHVEGRLSGYSWNLVHEYETQFTIRAHEVHPERVFSREYSCRSRFMPDEETLARPFSGLLMEEPAFSVHAELLDHRIPCLGLCLRENFYVNIIKEGLRDLGLPVGPWLNSFKAAIYRNMEPGEEFPVLWKEKGGGVQERRFIFEDLVEKIARISPGRKIAYITDVAAGGENRGKILKLVEGSDILFMEAAFLDAEKDQARKKFHLTAKEAGQLAREAGVRRLRIFHFSPRYRNRGAELEREAMEAFAQGADTVYKPPAHTGPF
jgi:ribonuclease Z